MPRAVRALTSAVAVLTLAACTSSGGPGEAEDAATPTIAPVPTAISASLTPADTPACLPAGTATVTTGAADDPTLVSFAGGGTRGVLLAPQDRGDACQWADELARLAGEGYLVASFGWADDGRASFLAAADTLRSLGATDVALVGASKGGTYSAALAAEVDAVAVVALGPPAAFDGQDAQSASSSYDGPLLVIASTDDSSVGVDSSEAVARADDPSTFVELSGSAHGVALLESEHREQVQQAIDDTLATGFDS
ncbi:hypothetical protein HP550_03150 [Cellulomonas humilata]|uniref:Alpha/beta hydrolase n=1 Tax=Cellulomonas humilata TaxID=144055 RepID=A0A7Y5ZY48_9CELL|nr:hypothetical protein [Cellulomonas humilata]NUU16246.1 hypothetical protein [Cellulomonas humilata]